MAKTKGGSKFLALMSKMRKKRQKGRGTRRKQRGAGKRSSQKGKGRKRSGRRKYRRQRGMGKGKSKRKMSQAERIKINNGLTTSSPLGLYLSRV